MKEQRSAAFVKWTAAVMPIHETAVLQAFFESLFHAHIETWFLLDMRAHYNNVDRYTLGLDWEIQDATMGSCQNNPIN